MSDFNLRGRISLDYGNFVADAKRASSSLNELNTSASTAASGMRLLSGAIATLGLGKLATSALKASSDFQQAEIAFTTLLGSAQEAGQYLKDLQDFAARTPFELPGLLSSTRMLMAMGFEAGQTIPMLTAIGDAVAALGGGEERIQRITLALGQMRAKGKVSGEEMRQLAEAGIPAWEYLAQAAGKSTAEMMKLGENGAIPAEAAIQALIQGMENGIGTARGFAGSMEAQSKTMAGLKSTLIDTVRNAWTAGFKPYVEGNIGPSIEKLIPKVESFVNIFIKGLTFVVQNLSAFASAVASVLKPAFDSIIIPAFMAAVAVIGATIKALGLIGNFIKKNIGVFQALTQVVVIATLSYAAYRAQILLAIAATKAHAFWTAATTKSVNLFRKAQMMLNAAIAMNPIGMITAAVVALIAIFVKAWNNIEVFRKAVIFLAKAGVKAFAELIRAVGPFAEAIFKVMSGPLRMFLLVLSKIPKVGGMFKSALDVVNSGLDNVSEWADTAATKVEGFASTLDKLNDFRFKMPSLIPEVKTTTPKEKDWMAGFKFDQDAFKDLLGGGDETGKEIKKDLEGVIRDYNDFIKYEFAPGFAKGSEGARDAILSGLDQLKRVFDEQAKGLKGEALEKLKKAYEGVNETVRAMMPQAEKAAADLEMVSAQLRDAEEKYQDVLKLREEGAKKFAEVMRSPFGEPSALARAMSGAEATVDSIINMYDTLVEAVNKRFEGFTGPRKNELINFLTEQTAKLVQLAKRRDAAARALGEAQDHLNNVLQEQASFKSNITSSIKDFGFALADLADNNAQQVIKVIKSASGLVITQMDESSSGIDGLMKKMRERAKSIASFMTNIRTLLARGVSKSYVQELLRAGPEAAGYTAQLIASAGQDQINEINGIYSSIDNMTNTFGDEMAQTFFGNAVSMAKAMVAGSQAEYDSVIEEMNRVRQGIEEAVEPLLDYFRNLGEDSLKKMIEGLNKKKNELLTLTASIAFAISAQFQGVAASIGAAIAALSAAQAQAALIESETPVVPTTPTPPSVTPTPTPTTNTNIEKVEFNIDGASPTVTQDLMSEIERFFITATGRRLE